MHLRIRMRFSPSLVILLLKTDSTFIILSMHRTQSISRNSVQGRRAKLLVKPAESWARISGSERKGDVMPRRSSRSRWSALRPTNVVGWTLIASEPTATSDGAEGGQKVSEKRKDPLAPSRYSCEEDRERPSGIFSYYLDYPLTFSFSPFFADFDVSFVYLTSLPIFRSIFRPRATGYRIFEWLSRIRKAIATNTR